MREYLICYKVITKVGSPRISPQICSTQLTLDFYEISEPLDLIKFLESKIDISALKIEILSITDLTTLLTPEPETAILTRRISKTSNKHIYRFISPIKIDPASEDIIEDNAARIMWNNCIGLSGCLDVIKSALKREPSLNLAEYINAAYARDKTLYGIVTNISISVRLQDNELYGIAECTCTKELNETAFNNLKSYISGQYSDGWGESFEQHVLVHPTGDKFYANFWAPENWNLCLEAARIG